MVLVDIVPYDVQYILLSMYRNVPCRTLYVYPMYRTVLFSVYPMYRTVLFSVYPMYRTVLLICTLCTVPVRPARVLLLNFAN